jgi:hypothetical protein
MPGRIQTRLRWVVRVSTIDEEYRGGMGLMGSSLSVMQSSRVWMASIPYLDGRSIYRGYADGKRD